MSTELDTLKSLLNETQLECFIQCQDHYPKLFGILGHQAQIHCLLNSRGKPSYFYVQVIEKDIDLRFFKSCTLNEFYRKLILLDHVVATESKILMAQDNQVLDIDAMFDTLYEEDPAYAVIKKDYTILVAAHEAFQRIREDRVIMAPESTILH